MRAGVELGGVDGWRGISIGLGGPGGGSIRYLFRY